MAVACLHHTTAQGYELLTDEQRAAVNGCSIERRLLALGCPADIAQRAQQRHERRARRPVVVPAAKASNESAGLAEEDRDRLRRLAVLANAALIEEN